MKFSQHARLSLASSAVSALMFLAVGCASSAPIPSAAPSSPSSSPPLSAVSPNPTNASPATSAPATPDPNADPHEAILAVETRGGRCVDGPCGDTIMVNRDGRVLVSAKPPNQVGFVSPDAMAALERAIHATDFDAVLGRPFRGECPTAYDGQEIVVEVLTPDGVVRIASCEVEVDFESPLFTAISEAVGDLVPLLNQ